MLLDQCFNHSDIFSSVKWQFLPYCLVKRIKSTVNSYWAQPSKYLVHCAHSIFVSCWLGESLEPLELLRFAGIYRKYFVMKGRWVWLDGGCDGKWNSPYSGQRTCSLAEHLPYRLLHCKHNSLGLWVQTPGTFTYHMSLQRLSQLGYPMPQPKHVLSLILCNQVFKPQRPLLCEHWLLQQQREGREKNISNSLKAIVKFRVRWKMP